MANHKRLLLAVTNPTFVIPEADRRGSGGRLSGIHCPHIVKCGPVLVLVRFGDKASFFTPPGRAARWIPARRGSRRLAGMTKVAAIPSPFESNPPSSSRNLFRAEREIGIRDPAVASGHATVWNGDKHSALSGAHHRQPPISSGDKLGTHAEARSISPLAGEKAISTS